MECKTILAGLSEIKEYWITLDMLRYLLLIAGMDGISGLYTTKIVERCETFVLPRSGFRRWHHRAMLQSTGLLLLALAVLTGVTLFVSTDSSTTILLAAGILALNLILISNIQMFIIMISGKVTIGYLLCMLIQLLALFCSERLPVTGRILLIGNWGMLIRSTLVHSGGIPMMPALGAELVLLMLFWIFGWRVIRSSRKGWKQ